MKTFRSYLLLVFIAASIVISLISIWQSQYFMFVHLAGSFVLLAFVLMTMNFRATENVNSDWQLIGRIYFVLGWIYTVFLIITFIALTVLGFLQHHRGIDLSGATFFSALAIGIYAFLSMIYLVKARRLNKRPEIKN